MFKLLTKLRKTAGILALLIVLVTITITTMPAVGKTPSEGEQPLDLSADDLSCRFGVAAFGEAQGAMLSDFDVGWYLNFSTNPIGSAPENTDFLPMIRLKQVKDGDDIYLDDYTVSPSLTEAGLGAKIDANLGATWIVGNEPDRGPTEGSSGQDDMMPDMYARAFHDVYEYIKTRDPSAKVATAGLVEMTPGRLQYLDMVSEAYHTAYNMEIPADVWTMHIYIMPEVRRDGSIGDLAAVAVGTDPALGMKSSGGATHLCGNVNNDVYCFADHDNVDFFERQIRDMRIWMKVHGQQNKPLLITEYSVLYPYAIDPEGCFLMDEFGQCFPPTRVGNYLRKTFDLVNGVGELKSTNLGLPVDDYRLVQRVLWYSVYTQHVGKESNLYTNESLAELTAVGAAFQAETAERTPVPNLFAWNVANVAEFIVAPATTATVTLSADIYNNGDTDVNDPFTVIFYADEAMTDSIDSVTVPSTSGCAQESVTVSVNWSGLTPGVHRYWVEVDSSDLLVEGLESDNVTSGVVIIDPQQVFLPVLSK